MNINSVIVLAALALPISIAFLKLANFCLHRHAVLMLQEENIVNPRLYIGLTVLWCTVFIILLLADRHSSNMGQLIVNTLFLLGLLLITYIDLKYQYIFDEVLWAMALLAVIATPYIQHSFLERILGVLAGGALMLGIAICSQGMLGGGDIKMVAMFGLWQGWSGLPVCLAVAFVSAAVFALAGLATGRKKLRDTIAFGPYLALGAFVYWLGIYI